MADSGDNIVDFNLSESKYSVGVGQHAVVGETPRQALKDAALMSMDSVDFGLSESNFSQINLAHQRRT